MLEVDKKWQEDYVEGLIGNFDLGSVSKNPHVLGILDGADSMKRYVMLVTVDTDYIDLVHNTEVLELPAGWIVDLEFFKAGTFSFAKTSNSC